ncbi:MAG: 50S ribosomal protein L25 [Actinobacteria bacterium]|nr:50S ribosomal protein L25 [Actinomycetota bacterium]MBV8396236.1 50S ribosomal protein L25 [Actinomycetota bacterium]MBV8599044.1 50S ribosomal protein L25 [Actinomycetota bacterium]
MAGERVKITASKRERLGTAESRRLRRQGLVPGVLYGREKPVAIALVERDLRTALTTTAGTHAVLDLTVDGGASHSAILKEFQLSKVRGKLTHVDLQEVRLDQPIHSAVAVHLVGDPVGVREGGVLSQVVNEVHVEALPLEMPEHFDVDVSGMRIGDSLRLTELAVPGGVTLLDDPEETVLATVTMPTRVDEPSDVLAEGEEGALEGVPAEERPEGAEAEPDAPAAGGEGTVEG